MAITCDNDTTPYTSYNTSSTTTTTTTTTPPCTGRALDRTVWNPCDNVTNQERSSSRWSCGTVTRVRRTGSGVSVLVSNTRTWDGVWDATMRLDFVVSQRGRLVIIAHNVVS